MAVNVRSRHFSLQPLDAPGDDGPVPHLPSRPQPPLPTAAPVNHVITGADSLELLAWRYYGRSTAWWHIADANPLAFPLDYRPGQRVTLPEPTSVGRVLRTRAF